ncbi:MAG: SCO family protein [candidate division KSB1 bacterium]|nr:SCO family protein [candidate division KSB1 bacterium]MDZ7276376.1 SCO family protein [candidate division KSB1 bacterium]MDZ7287672.1 SCO family protein [candidate division KSB1 bacterium]MDZ7299988.1 SCO family protein [candidate division KSB1 bacterium]MDZ7307343.1 SCO family protein [candidate division KSB1 bacterium]
MRLWLPAILALAACACRSQEAFHATEMPATPISDFVLQDQHGRPFKLSEQRGRVVVFFFGYTFCPDVCPLTLSTWKRVHDALQADTARVRFVYVTVDPERDTPEKLKTHLAIFHPGFTGLTGSPEALREVYADFGVYAEKVNIAAGASGYLVNHSTRMFVVDPRGDLRLLIDHAAPVPEVVHDLRLLLAGKK